MHLNLHYLIVDEMDMQTHLRWRKVCREAYGLVCRRFMTVRRRILSSIVPDADRFLDLLTIHRGVVGGVAAVAFVLGDPRVFSGPLEVFVPASTFTALLRDIIIMPDIERRKEGQEHLNARSET